MLGYKLTDSDGYSRRNLPGETHWSVGATVAPIGIGVKPCGPGVLHDYEHPLLAILFNPIHAGFINPRMFVLEHDELPQMDETKRWTTHSVRVVNEMEPPKITLEQRVQWAKLVAAKATKVTTEKDKYSATYAEEAAKWAISAWSGTTINVAEAAMWAVKAGVTVKQLIELAEEIIS